MNKVFLMGRLTKDPEVRYTQGQPPMTIAKYTLAIDRRVKKDGEQSADFISCTAFSKNGEFAEKYLKKGTKIVVEGRIQTGSYDDKDGKKVYTTTVIVDSHEFAESKKDDQQKTTPEQSDEFINIPEGIDELPFK